MLEDLRRSLSSGLPSASSILRTVPRASGDDNDGPRMIRSTIFERLTSVSSDNVKLGFIGANSQTRRPFAHLNGIRYCQRLGGNNRNSVVSIFTHKDTCAVWRDGDERWSIATSAGDAGSGTTTSCGGLALKIRPQWGLLIFRHLANICLKSLQGMVNSLGVSMEAMKIWQFAVLVLILAGAVWLSTWLYAGMSHEVEFVLKHQEM